MITIFQNKINEEWGHNATLFFTEMMRVLEKLGLRLPKRLIWHCSWGWVPVSGLKMRSLVGLSAHSTMLIWMFLTTRKGSVFVRGHMEIFRLFKFRNVSQMQIKPNFQKSSHHSSNKIFATKRSNFHNKSAKVPTLC